MEKIKSDTITAIHPDTWPTWGFVELDNDTYTDSSWNGCDYRVNDDARPSNGLAIDIYITGRLSKWNGVTYETRARIVFPNDGEEPDKHVKGKVYSTAPIR